MVGGYERKAEIIQFLQPYMEECFQKSCQIIQIVIEDQADKIWDDLKRVVCRVLENVNTLQKQHEKGSIQYLAFSFMRYGIYLDRLELRIDALDDSFYLDEQEVERYYCPTFLYDRYMNDIDFLWNKTSQKFIRLQNYELMEIQDQYSEFYSAIIFQMLGSLIELIMEEIVESNICITDNFKIIYGEYMDEATVLYAKRENRDEVFFHRNR